ncbi:hypothetical protein KZ829_06500 [Actinoplanes hulinensis]|uniref:Lipoprotein n=1 Tax=Actinoplanes hulinensis TaxID=1144547 RepID=A0ABS7AXA0_9ACTN|nr:hypothetical protein [Actinoplanes hulinensis]MBW6433393.1 hypothetical protein [Actinoplanes hulinensis]
MTATRVLSLAAAAATLLIVTACSGESVETKSEADTTALVQAQADKIAKLVGGPLENPSTGPMPCTGKRGESGSDIYSIQGSYNISTPAGETPRDGIARVRADWQAQGYTITDDRDLEPNRGIIEAKTPDGFSLSVESPAAEGFAVFVFSPCFTRP